jgi:hypothetical protein
VLTGRYVLVEWSQMAHHSCKDFAKIRPHIRNWNGRRLLKRF